MPIKSLHFGINWSPKKTLITHIVKNDPITHTLFFSYTQVSTTKGTGGDVIILEEAAYCDPGFFYETVAPLMLIGRTSLLAISTLTSEINFYSRLIKMKDLLMQVIANRSSMLGIFLTKKTGTHLQDVLRGARMPKVQGERKGHRLQAYATPRAILAEL
jgi:hypothetical protein